MDKKRLTKVELEYLKISLDFIFRLIYFIYLNDGGEFERSFSPANISALFQQIFKLI